MTDKQTFHNRQFSEQRRLPTSADTVIDAEAILSRIGEVPYVWNLQDDTLAWGKNASAVLQIDNMHEISTGRAYALHNDPKNEITRFDAVFEEKGEDYCRGGWYQIEYCLLPKRRSHEQAIWVEDTGCTFVDEDGKPLSAHGIVRIINDRHKREERLIFLSERDSLTGEFNHARLSLELSNTLKEIKRNNIPCAFFIAAIDNLRIINEAYGFAVADEVIATVIGRLKEVLRQTDVIGRLSGNKFGLILRQCSEDEHEIAAERFIKSVSDEVIKTSAGPVSVTISLGSIMLPHYADSAQDTLLHAEDALESAKRRHRGSFQSFCPNQEHERLRKANIRLSNEVIAALNERRLSLAYQPIVDAYSGSPVIYECLLRMNRSDNSIITAGEFIPLAEKLGFTRLLDFRVLELVMNDLESMPDAHLAINISGDSSNDLTWLGMLASTFIANRGLASRLVVEITETSALENIEETQRFVSTLKDLGCRVAIDDFGAGYTSFKNLKLLDVDLVKIDGSFIRNLASSAEDKVFVRTLAELAQTFNRKTIAEWVVDEPTADLLRSWGIDYFQGHLYGKASLDKPYPYTAVKTATL